MFLHFEEQLLSGVATFEEALEHHIEVVRLQIWVILAEIFVYNCIKLGGAHLSLREELQKHDDFLAIEGSNSHFDLILEQVHY